MYQKQRQTKTKLGNGLFLRIFMFTDQHNIDVEQTIKNFGVDRMSWNNGYGKNGILTDHELVRNGDNLKIIYDGLLAQSGAEHVYLHIGEGEWFFNEQYVKMNRVEDKKFEADVHVQPTGETVNFCFKDCANNWDNNHGNNYILPTAYVNEALSEE